MCKNKCVKGVLYTLDFIATIATGIFILKDVKTFNNEDGNWPKWVPTLAWISFGINCLNLIVGVFWCICNECCSEENDSEKSCSSCCPIIITVLSFVVFVMSCVLFGYQVDYLKTKEKDNDYIEVVVAAVVKFVVSFIITCVDCCIKKRISENHYDFI